MIRLIGVVLSLFISDAFGNECGLWFDNFTAPLCTDAKYIMGTGTVITIGLFAFKNEFVRPLQKRTVQKNHLKKWGAVGGDVGYGYLNGLYVLGNLMIGGTGSRKKAEHMTEASLYTLLTTQLLKKSIHETRPGFPDDHDSFPSGHASFSFAFASVVTANDGWFWGGLAHLAASLIAFSRMNDNWHYLHDVVFGATLGMSYGWGIYWNHQKYRKPYWMAFAPTADMMGGQLVFAYNY